MTPKQLLYLGSVWYLSATEYQRNQEQQQSSSDNDTTRKSGSGGGTGGDCIVKPTCFLLFNATQLLNIDDYLRIHHTPRRFPQVYQADWSISASVSSVSLSLSNNSNNSHNNNN